MMYMKFSIPTKFMFFKLPGKKGDAFQFSSDLSKVGLEWDVSVQNGTFIEVISDPVEVSTTQYGTLSLIKVKADVATDYHTIIKEFWVPESCIIKLD